MDGEGNIWTDVFYKETNTHDYLNYKSHHPEHTKRNIPFVLAKRIIVFTTREEAVRKNLNDLKMWLMKCDYPESVIDKGIFNARLQGPAPLKNSEKIIPLISTFYNNYNNELVCTVAKQLIKNSKNERVHKAFSNVKFVQAFKQPPNLLRILSHSSFITDDQNTITGVFKCTNKRCKICSLYLQEGTSFLMANGSTWNVKCFANCNSLNVLYYLVCNVCNRESYIGKSDNTRERTNNHITGCRHGNGSDDFDNHVYNCAKSKGMQLEEPFFQLYIMMVCNNYYKLLDYESKFHNMGLDTMNRPFTTSIV